MQNLYLGISIYVRLTIVVKLGLLETANRNRYSLAR